MGINITEQKLINAAKAQNGFVVIEWHRGKSSTGQNVEGGARPLRAAYSLCVKGVFVETFKAKDWKYKQHDMNVICGLSVFQFVNEKKENV